MPVRTKTTDVRYLRVGGNVVADAPVYSMATGQGQLPCLPQSEEVVQAGRLPAGFPAAA